MTETERQSQRQRDRDRGREAERQRGRGRGRGRDRDRDREREGQREGLVQRGILATFVYWKMRARVSSSTEPVQSTSNEVPYVPLYSACTKSSEIWLSEPVNPPLVPKSRDGRRSACERLDRIPAAALHNINDEVARSRSTGTHCLHTCVGVCRAPNIPANVSVQWEEAPSPPSPRAEPR